MKASRLIHKDQRGFTLIEVLVAVAITGLIISGISMAISQVFTGQARMSNHMIAVRQVQNAGFWVSRDGLMAQNVDTNDDTATYETELVTLTWTDWHDVVHTVVYTLLDNSELWRNYNGRQMRVAQFIDPTETNVQVIDVELTFTITATVGAGQMEASETRVYRIIPRPGL